MADVPKDDGYFKVMAETVLKRELLSIGIDYAEIGADQTVEWSYDPETGRTTVHHIPPAGRIAFLDK